MREILFRGKRIDNGEWVEGFYAQKPPHVDRVIHHYILIFDFREDFYDYLPRYFEVDPSTVCMCVPGITDNKGEKIFEGDIISDGGFTGIVVFDDKDDGAFLVIDPADPAGEADGEFFSGLIDREVCGNIYDNSELLDVEE